MINGPAGQLASHLGWSRSSYVYCEFGQAPMDPSTSDRPALVIWTLFLGEALALRMLLTIFLLMVVMKLVFGITVHVFKNYIIS
jgi:hypothetical protein